MLQSCIELEKGRMHCMIQLGHFESVIHQCVGLCKMLPDLRCCLAPLGVEASWRLSRWDD